MHREVEAIHQASMRIVRETGVRFLAPEAIEVFRCCGIRTKGDMVFFTEEQLMHWVGMAPAEFNLYARNPCHNVKIGGGEVNLAPGYGASLIMEDEGKRPAVLRDYLRFSKLFQGNPNFNINGGILVQPADILPENAMLVMLYVSYLTSDKCLMTGSGDREQLLALMELAMCAFGSKTELIRQPRLLTIVNTNTPLQMDRRMLDTLLTFAEYGQPVAVTSGAMAGSTAPVTLAGMLAVANAEVLAAIALAQMVRPGTPVVYATQCETSDMRNGSAAIGSPEGALCYQYSAHMARYYHLPSRGGGALTDAKSVNAQAGYEAMATYLLARQSKVDLMIHSAGILDSYACMSFEKLMVDFEIIDYVKRLEQGFPVSEDRIPLGLIRDTGPGGQYLTAEHTLEYCRREPFIPAISVRGPAADKGNQLERNIEQRLEKNLSSYQQPHTDSGIRKRMRKIMEDRHVQTEILERMEEEL